MSAMEGMNGQADPTTKGSNGTSSTNSTPMSETTTQKQTVAIAQISSDLPNPSQFEIRGIVTLLWPYSSLTQSLALNLAEPDVKLRSDKGQVKICFTGPLGKYLGAAGLGIDDQLVLSLEGAEFVKIVPRDSRDVGWELRYGCRIAGRITNRETGDVILDREEQPELEVAPVVPASVVVEVPSHPTSPPKKRVSAIQIDDGEWSSPAFIKRARLSYGSLMSPDFSAFIEDDGPIPGEGRKKAKFKPRKSGTWRYQSESRSPSPEVEDTPMAEPETESEPERPKAKMMEQGCQTDDLPYHESEIQGFFRQSQAIGREVRKDPQSPHMLQDEGVQTMFERDEAEMFSPITLPPPSTTPFGNSPVPLFGQSTTPFGEPARTSTTPMEPLPEHYQSLVSPLASRSSAPLHQEGQWPSSLFESMGYRPTSSLAKSITSHTSIQQEHHEIFSPQPMPSLHPDQDRTAENHNSAALALEELSRIHLAQQIEDAIEYHMPAGEVPTGSMSEVAPALSPAMQSVYPELPEHKFLTPQQPSFDSRQRSPEVQSAPRSSRQPPYPAETFSRERPGTPQQRQTSPMPVSSPFQRAGSQEVRAQSETIDLTGESDDVRSEGYSKDEQTGEEEEQVMPGESFQETRQRLLEEGYEESESDGEMEGEDENMTEAGVSAWRGQPSMIPKSKEREEEDSNDEGEVYEGDSEEEDEDVDEDEDEDEKMSEMDFGQRGVLLNPRPQVLIDRNNPDLDADGDAEDYYSEDEVPASQQQEYSDDEDEEGLHSDSDNNPIDPDLAAMPGSDSEEYYEEEYEEEQQESELEADERRWAGEAEREEDRGHAYGQSGRNSSSETQSHSKGEPVVIDLLSDSGDESAPPAASAVAKYSPAPPTSQQVDATAKQSDDGSDNEDDDHLTVEADEHFSDEGPSKENATEIAEHEREVYDEEHEDDSPSFYSQDERISPMSPPEEDVEIEAEISGYEDEDATAEEPEPQDVINMDGGWESKPVKSSPANYAAVKSSPLKKQSMPVLDPSEVLQKAECVEPPAQDEGEDGDVEDFEVPKENFDSATVAEKMVEKPIDSALLAARDEDRPVQATHRGSADSNNVVEASQLDVETTIDGRIDADSNTDAAASQLASAALLAERDEDRPAKATQNANAEFEADTEAAQLAVEEKVDHEVDADLRASKDQELAEEARHDIEMAEIVPHTSDIEKSLEQTKEMAKESLAQETRKDVDMEEDKCVAVPTVVEPGPRGDPEDIDMDGDVKSGEDLVAISLTQAGQELKEDYMRGAVKSGPRDDPEDADMDGDVAEPGEGLATVSEAQADLEQKDVASDSADITGDVQSQADAEEAVPAVVIDDNAEAVASNVEQEGEDEDEYEDPSSQLFEEMSYIEQSAQNTQAEQPIETTEMEVDQSEQVVANEFMLTENTQDSVWATQQTMEASVFSQEVDEITSFQTLPASQPQEQTPTKNEPEVEKRVDIEPVEPETLTENSKQDTATGDRDQIMSEGLIEKPARHTRSHDKPSKAEAQEGSATQPDSDVQNPTMDLDEHPAPHTRSHGKHAESAETERSGSPAAHTRSHDAAGHSVEDGKTAIVEEEALAKHARSHDLKMQSIEEDEHPASHTRSHDKPVEQLQKTKRSGSPAEHTRSHDALAGHCVEDDKSMKGLQRSSRRKSTSRKGAEQPSEQNAPSMIAPRGVTPVVEVLVSSSIENAQETPSKRVTRSRGGTQESVKPVSPPKKRALAPVVEVPASITEEAEAVPVQEKPEPEPTKRVTRSRQGTEEPAQKRSPPKTRLTRRKSLTPVVEIPASSIEPLQEEPSPPKRTTRARKASIQTAPKATTPPKTQRMSLRSQASPGATLTERSGSLELRAIDEEDEEDDELPDPGAKALLEYDDSPQKQAGKPYITSAPAPARNLRTRRNASPELESSGVQAVLETPIKTRARSLRSQPQHQTSQASTAIASSQLAAGLVHSTPNQPKDPGAEALQEFTSPAAPMTPANKKFPTVEEGTPLETPSGWDNMTPSAVAAQITKTLRTQLPAYTPLKNIKNHLKKKIDVLCVCVATPEAAVKSKHTPYDYVMKFWITEPGSSGTVKEVTAFHHFKKCLPEMKMGNVVLLRSFVVDGRDNGCLRSEKDSSWAVWRKDTAEPECKSDVPLEFEGGEDEYAKQLRAWWEDKLPVETKEKMKNQAHKGQDGKK